VKIISIFTNLGLLNCNIYLYLLILSTELASHNRVEEKMTDV